jgi:hypothetical protein
MNKRTVPGNLVPVAFQSMSLSNSTAVAVSSAIRASSHCLHISVETNDVRYRSDATLPTLTTGILLEKDASYWFNGYNGTANMRFQRSTGTSKVSIMGYSYVGD